MQQWGVKYWKTYNPVVNCIIVRSILDTASIHEFTSKSIDFVLAFSEADIDVDVFMDIPLVIGFDRNIVDWVIKLNKSIYGIKQASANWFHLINTGLERTGYHKFQVDNCVFYRKDSVILTYVDDGIIVSYKQEKITSLKESPKNGPENVVLTDEGDISNDFGVKIKKKSDGTFKLL